MTFPNALAVASIGWLTMALMPAQAGEDVWQASQSHRHDDVEIGELDNRFRYVLLESDRPGEAISYRLVVGAGSIHDPLDRSGLTHLLEHMAFRGTVNFMPGELNEIVRFKGLRTGPHANAFTTPTHTIYHLDITSHDIGEDTTFIDFLSDVAFDMTLPREEVDVQKQVVNKELLVRENNALVMRDAYLNRTFPNDAGLFRIRDQGGEQIDSITRRELDEHYLRYYTPDNMLLVVVGDYEKDVMKTLIESRFSGATGQSGTPPAAWDIGALRQSRRIDRVPLRGDGVTVQLSTPPYKLGGDDEERTYHDEILRQLALELLGRIFSETANRVAGKYIGFEFRPIEILGNWQSDAAIMTSATDDWQTALGAALGTLESLADAPLPDAMIESAKARLLLSLRHAQQTFANLPSGNLANLIVRRILLNRPYKTPDREIDEITRQLDAIDAASVRAHFATAWAPETIDVMVFADSAAGIEEDAVVTRVESTDRAGLALPGDDVPVIDLGVPAGQFDAEVAEHRSNDQFAIDMWQLKNNVYFNYVRRAGANDLLVRVRFPSGWSGTPPERRGIGLFAPYTFLSGGTVSHTIDELAPVLRELGIDLSLAVDGHETSLFASTRPDSLPQTLNILRAFIEEPGYRTDGATLFRSQIDAILARINADPGGTLNRLLTSSLGNVDFSLILPERDDIAARTMQELREWFDPVFRELPMELTIVGAESNLQVLSQVQRTFGTLATRPRFEDRQWRRTDRPDTVTGVVLKHAYEPDERKSALTAVAWPVGKIEDGRDYQRVLVLARVIANRVYHRLRDRDGSSYVADARYFNLLDSGYVNVTFDSDPDAVDEVVKLLRAEVARLSDHGIDEAEFIKASRQVFDQLLTELRNPRGALYFFSSVQQYPELLTLFSDAFSAFERTRPRHLERTVARYFDVEPNAISVVPAR